MEKLELNVDEFRNETISFNQLKNVDCIYTFYYDETNNPRKFYLRDDGFNESENANFILGGVMHQGDYCSINFEQLISDLKLQSNVTEMKLKHVASGDFLKCLNSLKLCTFLKWLLDSELYIHYSRINVLYFSIVDIVDSLMVHMSNKIQINNKFILLDRDMLNKLKSSLYELFLLEKQKFIELFNYFEYPNIKSDKINKFLDSFIKIISEYSNRKEFKMEISIIKKMIKTVRKNNRLPFIMDNENYQLIHSFLDFYLRPIYLFKNSIHIFDNEEQIKTQFEKIRLIEKGIEIKPYRFVDSKQEKFIQISDIIIGLIGKFSLFINSYNFQQLTEMREKLNSQQQENLSLFDKIINKSNIKNHALLMNSISHFEDRKTRIFLS